MEESHAAAFLNSSVIGAMELGEPDRGDPSWIGLHLGADEGGRSGLGAGEVANDLAGKGRPRRADRPPGAWLRPARPFAGPTIRSGAVASQFPQGAYDR